MQAKAMIPNPSPCRGNDGLAFNRTAMNQKLQRQSAPFQAVLEPLLLQMAGMHALLGSSPCSASILTGPMKAHFRS